ncbi:hypothetical protein P152DRAFT_455883 [Eremomyces bilateralis CBS 781.70]|uniref:Uncharacterized protein n=1 Tax=Eremomyces bilateralis CBS 781.70 TaxID=1392243 RepID=A0A6G1G9Z2_9PEZI|nr:uncharacterized protein P152DRAFT_455883 [Eremomyces bilateralis CBS 781.70]KAF1814844.1 hypothetical protein P152DRAFT_455883 [Eremomyces bilateralis CBS 781.70]
MHQSRYRTLSTPSPRLHRAFTFTAFLPIVTITTIIMFMADRNPFTLSSFHPFTLSRCLMPNATWMTSIKRTDIQCNIGSLCALHSLPDSRS